METKRCSKCGEVKGLGEFVKDNGAKDKLYRWCKICVNNHHAKYYLQNKDKASKYSRDRRADPTFREESKQRVYKWRKANRDRNANNVKRHYEKNKDKINKQTRDRKKTDIQFRLKANLRTRIAMAIKRNTKSYPLNVLLGCSIDFLKQHLESQFHCGMSWENRGLYGWHIDHIRPCASFDLTDPEQQKQCFHYSNLQPLWAEDNLSKNDRYQAAV